MRIIDSKYVLLCMKMHQYVDFRGKSMRYITQVCQCEHILHGSATGDDSGALLAGQRTCDSQVAGSRPGCSPLRKLYLHLCASVTKQYNLVPAKG